MGVNLSGWTLQHRALTLFAMLALAAAGAWAYLSLGRAEDPAFTIKQMVVVVDWPGASAEETARQVTDRIERRLEDLPYLDTTQSQTRPGRAVITVSLRDDTPTPLVQGLWYQVRKKIGDMAPTLPQGVRGPYFNDEFGDTYVVVYALTGDGLGPPALRQAAEGLRDDLLTVPGVGKIVLVGQQADRVYLDLSFRKLAEAGLTVQDVFAAVRAGSGVVSSGFVDTALDRIQVHVQPSADAATVLATLPLQARGRVVRLSDVATISHGTVDPPEATMRVDGKPALGLGITMTDGDNVLALGRRVADRVATIRPTLPAGVQLHRLNDQPEVVAHDIDDFQESFVEALAIVLLVSFLSLGWRAGLVVAISVPLVLAGVFVGMKLVGIDLQRISLGAMVIALGLLVDDAIIAIETMTVKMEQGWDRVRAGSFAYTSTAFPMLTGTLVTVAGYLPVGLARSSTGEYTQDIFRVVGLALVLSWFVAVLFVPFLGAMLLPQPKAHAHGGGVYQTAGYRRLRLAIAGCVRWRWAVIGATLVAFAAALVGFGRVPRQFFPSSDRLEVLIDMRLPEGASFAATAADVGRMEGLLAGQPGIASYAAYTGTGTPRFFLAFAPELEQPNYAQFVVNTKSVPDREALLTRLNAIADQGQAGPFPDVRLRPSRLELGPPVGYPVQFRILGPDPAQLLRIAAEMRAALQAVPDIRNVNDSWGAPARAVTVDLDQDKARASGVSGAEVGALLQMQQGGVPVAEYRQNTQLIPIVARAAPGERQDSATLGQITVAMSGGRPVPLSQVARVGSTLEQPVIWHRNRTPVLVVRGDTVPGVQAPDATDEALARLEAVKAGLPPGYRIETASTVEESAKGLASIKRVIPLMLVVMLSLLMVQLQSFSRVAMVLLTAPLGLIGVTAALLATAAPFGFVATLGFIALAGIIMRNSVILVDQIESDIRDGAAPAHAIVEATVRRARPILLTAVAAILALVPLAFSVFWGPMAIAIMGGLVSATVLTLCFVPALYAAWFRVR